MRKIRRVLPVAVLLIVIALIIIAFTWNESNGLSTRRKINSDKIAALATSIGALVTAYTAYLISRQIKEQIADRKASHKPELYPINQLFNVSYPTSIPYLWRPKDVNASPDTLLLRNIGLGAAKEIQVVWYFNKEKLAIVIPDNMADFFIKRLTSFNYSFVLPNNKMEIRLPPMYVASLAEYRKKTSNGFFENILLELNYSDIGEVLYKKYFKVSTLASAVQVKLNFSPIDKKGFELVLKEVMTEGYQEE